VPLGGQIELLKVDEMLEVRVQGSGFNIQGSRASGPPSLKLRRASLASLKLRRASLASLKLRRDEFSLRLTALRLTIRSLGLPSVAHVLQNDSRPTFALRATVGILRLKT
jgi:hypothetical protein